MVTGSLYFLGKFRPLYIEDTALAKVVIRLRHAAQSVSDPALRDWLCDAVYRAARESRNYQSVSLDHCNKGVSIAFRPHDPWLDNAVKALPECPGLNYNA